MKRVRLMCPNCQREQVSVEDEGNVSNYSERLIYQSCPDCVNTPEARLLNAIFGQKAGNSNLWKGVTNGD